MTDRPTVLVPVRVLEGEAIPEGVPELLAHGHVILLGYHVIPEQTAPGQAKLQWEDQARERLEDLEQLFLDVGATVDPRLVFTHDAQQTFHRQIREHGAMAVLVPDAVLELEQVLVPVRGTVGSDRLAQVVAGLFGEAGLGVTLLHVADEEESDQDAETLLDAVASALVDLGVAESAIETRVERDVEPLDAIVEASQDADVVVMGESDPTLATYFFGMPATQVNEQFLGPVLVVQRALPASENDD
jgi:nucleotide-binding universal stress UspA family protein